MSYKCDLVSALAFLRCESQLLDQDRVVRLDESVEQGLLGLLPLAGEVIKGIP